MYLFLLEISSEKGQKAPFLHLLDSLRLGEPEIPPDHILICLGVALVRLGEPLRLRVALLRLGVLANPVLFSFIR